MFRIENISFHYADSINLIVKRGNELKTKAFAITMDNAQTFQDYEEAEHNMVSLEYGQNMFNKNGVLPDFEKIGEYPKDKTKIILLIAAIIAVISVLIMLLK